MEHESPHDTDDECADNCYRQRDPEHPERADLRSDYLYVPKGSYTIGGREEENTTALRRTLVRSDRYRPIYENRGTAVFRVVPAPDDP